MQYILIPTHSKNLNDIDRKMYICEIIFSSKPGIKLVKNMYISFDLDKKYVFGIQRCTCTFLSSLRRIRGCLIG